MYDSLPLLPSMMVAEVDGAVNGSEKPIANTDGDCADAVGLICNYHDTYDAYRNWQ